MSRLDHLKGKQTKRDPTKYDERPELHGIVHRENFELVNSINKITTTKFDEEWYENVRRNKKMWRRHPKLHNLKGLGRNKCVIGIGAGPSFKKNCDVLKRTVDDDGRKHWEDRDFITIAANHQFKPLLEMGVIPDFVLLVDAGNDAVYDQLCRDVPPSGKNSILLTGLHVLPKITRDWAKQGRNLVLYTTNAPPVKKAFKEHIKGEHIGVELGGNCLNGAWMIGLSVFQSTVFMGIGNDLSFEPKETADERRKSYYHDGDYTTNAKERGSGRDEAKSDKMWAGFRLDKKRIWSPHESRYNISNRYNIELDTVGTSHTLWVYKAWLETTIMGQTQNPTHFHYFNCTEGGILGVMAKETHDSAMKDPKNWYLFDEVAQNIHTGAWMYHTAMLSDAVDLFKKAKGTQTTWHSNDVQYADGHGQSTG